MRCTATPSLWASRTRILEVERSRSVSCQFDLALIAPHIDNFTANSIWCHLLNTSPNSSNGNQSFATSSNQIPCHFWPKNFEDSTHSPLILYVANVPTTKDGNSSVKRSRLSPVWFQKRTAGIHWFRSRRNPVQSVQFPEDRFKSNQSEPRLRILLHKNTTGLLLMLATFRCKKVFTFFANEKAASGHHEMNIEMLERSRK